MNWYVCSDCGRKRGEHAARCPTLLDRTARQLGKDLKRLGLSQSEAARRLGVRQSTMYRWLAGERKIPGPVQAAVKCWIEKGVA